MHFNPLTPRAPPGSGRFGSQRVTSNAHISSPGVLLYIVIKDAFDRKQKESLELTPNEIEHPELAQQTLHHTDDVEMWM